MKVGFMIAWAIVFFAISLIAGYYGFFRQQVVSKTVPRTLFYVFLSVSILALLIHLFRVEI
ncbi:DUF1328 domain-containing protein [candidate division KSB1 bacterium]|nr:DUF1328 domain-containing protein [candidate division KSB1 bacterium]